MGQAVGHEGESHCQQPSINDVADGFVVNVTVFAPLCLPLSSQDDDVYVELSVRQVGGGGNHVKGFREFPASWSVNVSPPPPTAASPDNGNFEEDSAAPAAVTTLGGSGASVRIPACSDAVLEARVVTVTSAQIASSRGGSRDEGWCGQAVVPIARLFSHGQLGVVDAVAAHSGSSGECDELQLPRPFDGRSRHHLLLLGLSADGEADSPCHRDSEGPNARDATVGRFRRACDLGLQLSHPKLLMLVQAAPVGRAAEQRHANRAGGSLEDAESVAMQVYDVMHNFQESLLDYHCEEDQTCYANSGSPEVNVMACLRELGRREYDALARENEELGKMLDDERNRFEDEVVRLRKEFRAGQMSPGSPVGTPKLRIRSLYEIRQELLAEQGKVQSNIDALQRQIVSRKADRSTADRELYEVSRAKDQALKPFHAVHEEQKRLRKQLEEEALEREQLELEIAELERRCSNAMCGNATA